MKITENKLISLFDSFSDKDIKEFRKVISSVYFNRGRKYTSLFRVLMNYRKSGFKGITLSKIYSKLYPGKAFNIQTLDNRFSELYKLAEEYLINKTLKEDTFEKNRILLKAYHNLKTGRHFNSQYRKSKNYLNSFPESDTKFLNNITLERLNIANSREHKIPENLFRKYFEHSEIMAVLFLKNLFLFGIEFIQQEQTHRKYEFNISLELLDRFNIDDVFLKKLDKTGLNIFKIPAMLFYFYDIFKNPENEFNYFKGRKLFNELKNNGNSLEEDDITEYYKLMTSYCILRHNQGQNKFGPELFDLYGEILQGGFYLDRKGVFPAKTFRNYVLTGIILNKKKWTENFIKKYSVYLPEESSEDEIKISYSKLFFSYGKYERSLKYLKGFKGLNYLHYSDSTILKLCNYYEMESYEEAISEIDKFRHYLRNHKGIPDIHGTYYKNYLKIYTYLLKIRTSADKINTGELQILFKKNKPVSKESWLGKKISELK